MADKPEDMADKPEETPVEPQVATVKPAKTRKRERKKREVASEKKEEVKAKEQKESLFSLQNILALLLVVSLLGNAYLIIQNSELGKKLAESGNGFGTTTSTTQPSGAGKAAALGDYVKVDYIGSLINGTVFDTSIQAEAEKAGVYIQGRPYEPLGFVVGGGQTLEAFEDGIVGMKVGDTKTITIPAGEGYTTGILANQTLIFKVTLMEIPEVKPVAVTVLSDKRCIECELGVQDLMDQLTSVVPGSKFTQLDYMTDEGKKLYADAKLKYLPAILFTSDFEDNEGYSTLSRYLEPAGDYLSLRIGAQYDPTAEVDCGNGLDDNGDGLVDCADPTCAKQLECSKKDKPTVDVFVMSHCPYGTQIEKGLLPVVRLLGGSIDFNVRFCDYAMHGKKEVDEQLLQHCIQTEYRDKYLDYLQCFLNESKSGECVVQTGLDAAKLSACVNKTDAEFNVTASYNDKSTWVSGSFPRFDVDKELNLLYEVGGSPTLIVNGVETSSARDPQSLLEAICSGFKTAPAACSQNLSTANPSAGFGYTESDAASTASCGA